MRIIAGTAKGRRLNDFSGDNIRPTSDRIRESIFSALYSRLGSFAGIRVLDICSGTGAMSIEALSRGANSAILIDSAPASLQLAKENLSTCGFLQQAKLINGSVPAALNKLALQQYLDVVFLDPPYNKQLAAQTMVALADLKIFHQESLIAVETGVKEQLLKQYGPFALQLVRRYGSSKVHIYAMTG